MPPRVNNHILSGEWNDVSANAGPCEGVNKHHNYTKYTGVGVEYLNIGLSILPYAPTFAKEWADILCVGLARF